MDPTIDAAAHGSLLLSGSRLSIAGDENMVVTWQNNKLCVVYDDRRAAQIVLREARSLGGKVAERARTQPDRDHLLWLATDEERERLAALTPQQTREAEDSPRPRLAILAHNAITNVIVQGAAQLVARAPSALSLHAFEIKVGGTAQVYAKSAAFSQRLRLQAVGSGRIDVDRHSRIHRLRVSAQGKSNIQVACPVAQLVASSVLVTASCHIEGDPPVTGRAPPTPTATSKRKKRARSPASASQKSRKKPKKQHMPASPPPKKRRYTQTTLSPPGIPPPAQTSPTAQPSPPTTAPS